MFKLIFLLACALITVPVIAQFSRDAVPEKMPPYKAPLIGPIVPGPEDSVETGVTLTMEEVELLNKVYMALKKENERLKRMTNCS